MEITRENRTAPQLGLYEIDPGGSTVGFGTRHLFGLGPVRGGFAIHNGTIDVVEPIGESGVHVQIDAASFRSGNAQRDRAVRSARFLDAGRYPFITFNGEHFDGRVLAGTLTAHGVSQPISLEVMESEIGPGWFTARATTRIDRTAFGVTASRGLAARHLNLTMAIRCVRK